MLYKWVKMERMYEQVRNRRKDVRMGKSGLFNLFNKQVSKASLLSNLRPLIHWSLLESGGLVQRNSMMEFHGLWQTPPGLNMPI